MKASFKDFFNGFIKVIKNYKVVIIIAALIDIINNGILNIASILVDSELISFFIDLSSLVFVIIMGLLIVYLMVRNSVKVLTPDKYDGKKLIVTALYGILADVILFVTLFILLIFCIYFLVIPVLGLFILLIFALIFYIIYLSLFPIIYYSMMRYYLNSNKSVFTYISTNFKQVWKRVYGAMLGYLLSVFTVVVLVVYPIITLLYMVIYSEQYVQVLSTGMLIVLLCLAYTLCIIFKYKLLDIMMRCAISDYKEEEME